MNYREDFFSKEASFIRAAKRNLASGGERDSLDKLRLLCFSKGATGILRLGRSIRNMSEHGADSVNFVVFWDSITANDLDANEADVKDVFDRFAVDGMMNVAEFLEKLRPPLSSFRQEVMAMAFGKIEGSADGVISMETLKNHYGVQVNPKFRCAELAEVEVLTQLLKSYEGEAGHNGNITKEEFYNYYATISSSIASDDFFELLMRRAFKF